MPNNKRTTKTTFSLQPGKKTMLLLLSFPFIEIILISLFDFWQEIVGYQKNVCNFA